MLAQLTCLFLVTGGLPPAQMADVVADRLARLDRLVVEVEAEVYLGALLAAPLDQSAWSGPYDPGDGIRRTLRIVRPRVLEECYIPGAAEPVVTSFVGGRAVRRLSGTDGEGRAVYSVHEDLITSGTYTSVPLLQIFDLQVHESFIPGLNTLRLLREYPVRLVSWDNGVGTYAVSIELSDFGGWNEHYEFDLNARGTPLRFHFIKEALDGSGFFFERTIYTLATTEVNGAELITEAVAASRNSPLPESYGIYRMEVCSVQRDETLTAESVRLEPEQRNARVFIKHADLSEEVRIYDEAGNLVASDPPGLGRLAWRKGVVPLAGACGLVAASVVAFLPRRRGRSAVA